MHTVALKVEMGEEHACSHRPFPVDDVAEGRSPSSMLSNGARQVHSTPHTLEDELYQVVPCHAGQPARAKASWRPWI